MMNGCAGGTQECHRWMGGGALRLYGGPCVAEVLPLDGGINGAGMATSVLLCIYVFYVLSLFFYCV